MNIASRIVCRTVGLAGMGVALYDSAKISKQFAEIGSEHQQEHYLERAYFNSRTADKVSYTSNALREKTFELRSKNPLPGIYGKIKGGFQGMMYGLGNYLPVVICSTLALACKNWAAKAGALGVGIAALYKVAREGYGLGKSNPMD